jgi:hypothetical protein
MACLREWITFLDPEWASFCPLSAKTVFYVPRTTRSFVFPNETHKYLSAFVQGLGSSRPIPLQNCNSMNTFFQMKSYLNDSLLLTIEKDCIDLNGAFVVIYHVSFPDFDENAFILLPKSEEINNQIFCKKTSSEKAEKVKKNGKAES